MSASVVRRDDDAVALLDRRVLVHIDGTTQRFDGAPAAVSPKPQSSTIPHSEFATVFLCVMTEWLSVSDCRSRLFSADIVNAAGSKRGGGFRSGKTCADPYGLPTLVWCNGIVMPTPQSLSPASPRPGDLQVLRNILQRSYVAPPFAVQSAQHYNNLPMHRPS